MYIRRHMEEQILQASNDYPVVMVCGQRQVGKSTMLYHIKDPKRNYVTLDDRNARRIAETDPLLFFETYTPPLLIDEIQRVPDLLLEIKRIVDEKALRGENANGSFWLTGSQKFRMMKGVSESLAGRTAVFELSGLTAGEIRGLPGGIFSPEIRDLQKRQAMTPAVNIRKTYEMIFRGSMPKVISENIDQKRYYADYINTYLERDIHDLAQVGKLSEFYNFLVFMAARTGQELNYTDIARSIGISSPTAKEWVSILESSGVIYILRPYFSNLSKRLIKAPKMYFMDTGLAAYLCRWPDPQTLQNGAMDGAFFVTWVISEIVKSFCNAGEIPNLYYYRDIDKKEIDLLIISGDNIYPIEIKKGVAPEHADKNFAVLEKLGMNIKPGLIICSSENLIPYSRNTWYCPVSLI